MRCLKSLSAATLLWLALFVRRRAEEFSDRAYLQLRSNNHHNHNNTKNNNNNKNNKNNNNNDNNKFVLNSSCNCAVQLSPRLLAATVSGAGFQLWWPRSAAAAGPESWTWAPGDVFLAALLLGFCVAYLPEVLGFYADSGEKYGLKRVGRFSYVANRARSNFSDAMHQLAAKNPGHTGDDVFTYFDVYRGQSLPELASRRVARLIDRGVTEVFDDKRALASWLRESGCEGSFARSFLTAREALEATKDDAKALFFAKNPRETGGRGIEVLTRQDLESRALPDGYIIQQAVQDIELIEGRKFVVRFYFVVYNGELYMHRRGVLLVHGLPYDRDSVDFGVQVRHDWYIPGSQMKLLMLYTYPEGERWRAAIAQSLQEARPALKPLLEASSEDSYTLVGGDAIIDSSGAARLIEFNMYPNLWADNATVDTQVYVPMMEDLMAMILLGESRSDLERIGS